MSTDEKRLGMAGWSLLMGLKRFIQPSHHGGTSFNIRAFALLCLLIQQDSWHEGLCTFMSANKKRLGMAGWSLLTGLKWFGHPSHQGGTSFDIRAFASETLGMRAFVYLCLLIRRDLVGLVGLCGWA
jgi:hypothetical protein